MSFRLKLFIISALMGMLPTFLLGGFWLSTIKTDLQEKTFNELGSINQLSRSLLEEWTHGSIVLLESLAQRPLVLKNIATLLDEGDGPKSLAHTELYNNHFMPALKMGSNLKNLSVISLTGVVVTSSNPQLLGQIRDHEQYFTEGLKQSYIGNVTYSGSSGQAIIHVATPLKTLGGETIGLLTGQLDWDRASQLLALVVTDSESLESYLVNRHHFMLTASRFIAGAPLRVNVTTQGFQDSVANGKGHGIYLDYREIEVIGAYQWLPELDISLMTELDTAEMYKPLVRLKAQLFGISFAIITLSVTLAFLISRHLSKPIRALISGVAEFGKGHLRYRFSDIDPNLGPVKEALNEMAGQLQETIATRDTFNTQLQAANKELESFAYSVSHDLRAPLRAVDGFSQALAEDCGDQLGENGKTYLKLLRQGAQDMGGLIDDMLTLSRATRGDLNFQRTDLSRIAQVVADRLRRNEKDRLVDISIEPGLYAWCDERMLKIVFENLLGNAWKYTGKTENAKITLTLRRQDETTIEILIADNGAGFNNDYADKLFEPFQRLHRKDEFPGSGIGLSTVQRIIQRLGGTIRGDGQVDAGASFYVTLPRRGSGHG